MRAMKTALVMVMLSVGVFAQEFAPNNSTAVGNAARYQIVQSSLTARDTYRVDTYMGYVWVLSEGSNRFSWFPLLRLVHSNNRITNPNKINFQMFISGVIAKDTFLINVDTGATWIVTIDTDTKAPYLLPVSNEVQN